MKQAKMANLFATHPVTSASYRRLVDTIGDTKGLSTFDLAEAVLDQMALESGLIKVDGKFQVAKLCVAKEEAV